MAKGNAESLSSVLELARTKRLHGLMSIEYIRDGKVEEGEVFFQTGQPIQARVGQMIGQKALNWLMNWHNITYTIGADESLQPVSTTNIGNRNSTTPSATETHTTPNRNSSNGQFIAQKSAPGDASIRLDSSTTGIEWLVPRKRGFEREVLALPLTRRQRFIYFLVDGRRTVADLARCTGKNSQEIELILSELQEQGLIAV